MRCIMLSWLKQKCIDYHGVLPTEYLKIFYFRVLVGAPEAHTEQKRWGVEKPGAVFRCETNPPHR